MKPQWDNLLRNCCPKCDSDLLKKRNGSECIKSPCKFFIRIAVMDNLKVTLRRQQFISKMSNARRHRLNAA